MTAIKGTNVSAPIVPFDTQDVFGTHHANYGIGGFQSVQYKSELDSYVADHPQRIADGMRVRVWGDPTESNNTDWDYIAGEWVKAKPVTEASASAAAANTARLAAEAALDASLNSNGLYPSTAAALSNGVITLTNLVGGSGGTNGSHPLSFSGGGGSNAAGVFFVTSGSVTSTTITSSGFGYTSSPTVSFPGVTGASANVVIGINVANGSYFNVPSSNANSSFALYRNQSNTAVLIKQYPSTEYVSSFEYSVPQTFYVTMDGDDSYSGTSLKYPKRTVNSAIEAIEQLQLITPGLSCVVIVHPGDYTIEPDTVIPPNCALYGYDLRVTVLRLPAGLENNNMFQMSNGIKVRGFSFKNIIQVKTRKEDLNHYVDSTTPISSNVVSFGDYFVANSDNKIYVVNQNAAGYLIPTEVDYDIPPEKGYVFVFKPNEYLTRSPYLADCSQIHEFTYDEMTLPIDRANGNLDMVVSGGNLFANGAVLNNNSPLKSVVVDSFTAINPNAYAYVITKSAFVQLVSVFTNWSRYGIWAHDGGNVTIVNSNITFGDYALASTNYRYAIRVPNTESSLAIVDDNTAANTLYDFTTGEITAYTEGVIDDMWDMLVLSDEYSNNAIIQAMTVGELTTYETYTRRDAETLINAIAFDILSGQSRATRFFILGLFNWNAVPFIRPGLFDTVFKSYDLLYESFLLKSELDGAIESIGKLFGLVRYVLENYNNTNLPILSRVKIAYPSKIESTSHQFSYSGSGVNYNSLPPEQRGTGAAPDPRTTLIKQNGGKIYATFATEAGDTYLGEDIRVDFERNTIEGQAFSRGVQNITLPLVIGVGG